MGKERERHSNVNQVITFSAKRKPRLYFLKVISLVFKTVFIVISFIFISPSLSIHVVQATQTRSESDLLGLEWKGSENKEWDFTSVRRGSSNVFDYYAINRKNSSERITGEITVDLFGSKVKMTKTVHGKEVSVCDGVFSSDARFIGGLCYDLTSILEDRNPYPWWATIERRKKKRTPPCPLNINIATVKELEDVLALDPITAREIIEHKLIIVQYTTIYELVDTCIVSPQTFERIKPCISVR